MDDDLPRKKIEVLAQMTMQDMHALVDRLEQASATVQGAAQNVQEAMGSTRPENLQHMLELRDNLADTLEEINTAANLFETRVRIGAKGALDDAAIASILKGVSEGIRQAGLELDDFQTAAKSALQFSAALEQKISAAVAEKVSETVAKTLPENLDVIAQKAAIMVMGAYKADIAGFYGKIDGKIGEAISELPDEKSAVPWWQTALTQIGMVTAGVVIGIGIAKWLWH